MINSPGSRLWLHGIDKLAAIGVLLTGLAFLLGEFGRLHWGLELLSHFAVQYVLALLVAVLYFLLRRRWLWLGLAVAAVLVPAWRLAPYVGLVGSAASTEPRPNELRILTLNVHASSNRYDLVRAEIERLDPDIVFLPESTDRWATGLAPLRERYPFVVDAASPSVFSLILYSRVPLTDVAVIHSPEPGGFPAITARACPPVAAACLDIVGIHPPPPMAASYAAERDAAIDAVARFAGDRTVVLGDFNCTPWSPRFRDLLSATGLRDSAFSFGLSPTWFSSWLPIGIKIDHILIGNEIAVTRHEVGSDVGSDHYGVVADLAF